MVKEIEIRKGNDWLAGIDQDNYYVKFVGRPDTIDVAYDYVKARHFYKLEDFAKSIRSQFKFASVCSRAE